MFVRETDQPFVLDAAGRPTTPLPVRIVEGASALIAGRLVASVPVRAVDVWRIQSGGLWHDVVPVRVVETESVVDAQGHRHNAIPVRVIEGTLGFSLRTFMAAQSDGFWLDFRQADTLRQESTGPTLVNAQGQPIGLALSRRFWAADTLADHLAAQAELVVNGTFDTDLSGWNNTSTAPSRVFWEDGRANTEFNGSGNCRITQPINTVAGRLYRLSLQGTIAALRVGSAFNTNDVLANAAPGGDYFFSAQGATSHVNLNTQANARWLDNVSLKEAARQAGTQTGASARPFWFPDGAQFDGLDDVLRLPYRFAGAGANFMVARVTFPADVGASAQILAGASSTGPFSGFGIGINSAGRVIGMAGSQSFTAIIGQTDRRGQTVTVGLSHQIGGQTRLFVDDALEYEGAASGTPNPELDVFLGCRNSAGVESNRSAGRIAAMVVGRQALDLATHRNIRAKL